MVAVFQRKCFFSEAVFSDLLYNHDLVSHAAEPRYVDESPFGCDGELVDRGRNEQHQILNMERMVPDISQPSVLRI